MSNCVCLSVSACLSLPFSICVCVSISCHTFRIPIKRTLQHPPPSPTSLHSDLQHLPARSHLKTPALFRSLEPPPPPGEARETVCHRVGLSVKPTVCALRVSHCRSTSRSVWGVLVGRRRSFCVGFCGSMFVFVLRVLVVHCLYVCLFFCFIIISFQFFFRYVVILLKLERRYRS